MPGGDGIGPARLNKFLNSLSFGFGLCRFRIFFLEALHPALGINNLLGAREKRMTVGTYIDLHVANSRPGLKLHSTCATDRCGFIRWMNARFHCSLPNAGTKGFSINTISRFNYFTLQNFLTSPPLTDSWIAKIPGYFLSHQFYPSEIP